MDTGKLRQGELIAGIAGIALFVSLLLKWYDPATAWELFKVVDIVLAVIAVAAVGLPLSKAIGSPITLPVSHQQALAGLGALAFLIVLVFLLEGTSLGFGIFLALAATAAIVYGGWSGRTERTRRSEGRTP